MHVSPRAAARLSYVAAFGAVGAWYPYLAVFYQERGLDLGLIGLMTALGAAAGLVSAPIWGALADRFAGSPLIIPVAALVTAAGATALALSDSVGGMAAALVLSSVAFAGIAPTLDARALETVGDDRNRYGGLRAWGSGAFIVVVAFTGALVERAGITSMFIVYVAALLVLAVVSLPLRGDAGAPRLPRLDAIGVVLRHPPLCAVPAGRPARLVGRDGDQLVFLDPPDRARRARASSSARPGRSARSSRSRSWAPIPCWRGAWAVSGCSSSVRRSSPSEPSSCRSSAIRSSPRPRWRSTAPPSRSCWWAGSRSSRGTRRRRPRRPRRASWRPRCTASR